MVPICASMLEEPSHWHLFTHLLNNVPSLCPESLTGSSLKSSSPVFMHVSFFLSFIFIAHFLWACKSLCELWKLFFKFSFCTFICLSNNSLISQSNLPWSVLLPCMLYLSCYFQPEVKTLECNCERLLHCLIVAITWTPSIWFAKAFRYTIYIDVSLCSES